MAQSTLSAAHFIYIPLCVLVGLVLGWLLGARARREEITRLRRLVEELEQSEAAERRAAAAGAKK